MSASIDVRNHTELFLQAILHNSTEAPEVRNHLQLWLKAILEKASEGGRASDVSYDNTLSGLLATDVQAAIDELAKKPYLSLERVAQYLYKVSFAEAPDDTEDPNTDFVPAMCSSYVQDGKLYRNLDWNYDHCATFHVTLPNMEGCAFMSGLTDSQLADDLIAKLPYRLVDGKNNHGIMVSTHVLYNDWDVHGQGEIPLTNLPYIALSRVKSMATIEEDLDGVLDNLKTTPAMDAMEYLIQVLVTDGTTTYVLRPGNAADGTYEAVDITENPKLSNFWWVPDETVTRQQLQNRPTGVERWNMMPCPLEDLRFTEAYEEPTRLSEFIGLRGTTKDSTDEELTEIYETAHDMYEDRERDGSLWQTMHSAVYSSKGLEHLWIQEDWEKDYASSGGGSSDELWKPTVDANGNISWQKSTSSTPPTTQNIKGQPGVPGRDGTDGQDGQDGTDGADGKSAYASAQDGGYTGTEAQFNSDLAEVSDKQSKITASGVLQGDGNGGVTAKTVDSTPTSGSQNLVTSGGVFSAVSGKYSKPSSGIPKTDLASAVQTSLGRADSALQEHLLYKCDYGVTAYADVVAAINNGKIPYVIFSNHFFVYGKKQDSEVSFTVAIGTIAYYMKVKASGWSYVDNVYATTDDLTAYRTASAQDVIDATKADKPTIKTAMDAVAVVNTQYFLGMQSAVSITMPTTAEVGQEIKVYFKSGSTAATLTCDLTGFDFTPKANTAVLLTFRLVHKADAQVTGDVDEWTVEVKEG